ncbi:MAG: hypothetical protein HOP03_16505 [Lysobacter sp.]|nr:hypothetical protein [Lysobacter sp.]
MIPAISHVLSVEMIRDGGSLAADFRGADGCEYWLFFPIDLTSHATGLPEECGYLAPTVLDRLCGREFAITWKHALVFLDQIEAFPLCETSQRWLSTMREVAIAEGAPSSES